MTDPKWLKDLKRTDDHMRRFVKQDLLPQLRVERTNYMAQKDRIMADPEMRRLWENIRGAQAAKSDNDRAIEEGREADLTAETNLQWSMQEIACKRQLNALLAAE